MKIGPAAPAAWKGPGPLPGSGDPFAGRRRNPIFSGQAWSSTLAPTAARKELISQPSTIHVVPRLFVVPLTVSDLFSEIEWNAANC